MVWERVLPALRHLMFNLTDSVAVIQYQKHLLAAHVYH